MAFSLVSSDSDTEKILAEAYVEEMKTLKDSAEYLAEQSLEDLAEQSLDDLTEQSSEFSMEETLTEQDIKDAAQVDEDEVGHSVSIFLSYLLLHTFN